MIRRIALSRPDIAFAIWHNGKVLERWAHGNIEQRVDAILEKNSMKPESLWKVFQVH